MRNTDLYKYGIYASATHTIYVKSPPAFIHRIVVVIGRLLEARVYSRQAFICKLPITILQRHYYPVSHVSVPQPFSSCDKTYNFTGM